MRTKELSTQQALSYRKELLKKIESFANTSLSRNIGLFENKLPQAYFRRYFLYNSEVDLNSTKWKTYLYLMKCVWDHRAYHGICQETEHPILSQYATPHELISIIQFLEDEGKYGGGKNPLTNKQWLTARLMDKEDREANELWGSGEHEWLLRSLLVDVLKRSAGTFYTQECGLFQLAYNPLSVKKEQLQQELGFPGYIIYKSKLYYTAWNFKPQKLKVSDFQALTEIFDCNEVATEEDLESITELTGHKHRKMQSHEEPHCMFSSFDWLMLQAELRTKTKYLFFENESHSLESGHAGSVKKSSGVRGFLTEGSKYFHNELVRAFEDSCTIAGFLTRVKNVLKQYMVSGRHAITPTYEPHCLVDGTKTNNATLTEEFRTNKLHPHGYVDTRLLFWEIEQRVGQYDGKSEDDNSAESLSDSEDDTINEWMSLAYKG